MTRQEFNDLFTSIMNNPEFKKLASIGGEYQYHREGNAYDHTMMVVGAAKLMFKDDFDMIIIALLHDIGKIFTSKFNPETGFWNYPNHAVGGAEHLNMFLPYSHPLYKKVEWYIKNHIKPMFFHQNNNYLDFCNVLSEEIQKGTLPEGCTIKNLCKLVLCDWAGSNSISGQNPKVEEFVTRLAYEN